MPKLTERRHLQTRADIAHAAVDLFLSNGFDNTTMAEIAEAADVSRRTVYRHFSTKDELVFEYPRRWLEHYERLITTREEGESLRDLNRRALLSVAAEIDDDAEEVLAAFSVLQSTELLSGTHRKHDDRWTQRTIELFMAEPQFMPDQFAEIAVVAAATVAGTNTAIAMWALEAANPKTKREPSLVKFIASVLDQLDPIWPKAFR